MNKDLTIPKTTPALKKLDVVAIYLFRSYAEVTSGILSDIDIAILMKNAKQVNFSASTHKLYQKLYELLEPILRKYAKKINIIFLQRAPLELQAHVVRYGKVIYDQDLPKRLDYEEKIMLHSADFKFLQGQIDKAVLERI